MFTADNRLHSYVRISVIILVFRVGIEPTPTFSHLSNSEDIRSLILPNYLTAANILESQLYRETYRNFYFDPILHSPV